MVQIESAIVEMRGASTRWRQRVLRNDEVLAEGHVRIGLIGNDGRVARMPDTMRDQLSALSAAHAG